MTTKPTEIVTPPARLAFPSLFKPRAKMQSDNKSTAVDAEGEDLTYQAVLLLPPDTDTSGFKRVIVAAMVEKWGKQIPISGRGMPLKRCSEETPWEGFDDGWFFARTSTYYQPTVVDGNREPIIEPRMIYPGCWVRAHLTAKGWERKTGKGVKFMLNAVQFVRDGDRLDGRRDVKDVFDPVDPAGENVDSSSNESWFD